MSYKLLTKPDKNVIKTKKEFTHRIKMTEIFLIIYLASVVLTLILYFPRLWGFRLAFRQVPRRTATIRRKIAVLVPARGESKVIGDLLRSVSSQSYGRENFDVFVIVKDSSDPTVEIAKRFGAEVTVVPEQNCKGDALHGFFENRPADFIQKYDAYAIVDADGIMSDDFLSEINNALENGADVVIPQKVAKNFLFGKKSRSLISNCSAITYPAVDDFGNRYREKKGMPLNICGQGMVVSRKIISDNGGWNYRTVTEDYELKLVSLLKGYKSTYYPYAVLYTEEVTGNAEDFKRRVRWLTGYKQCDRKYKSEIRKRAVQRKRLALGEGEYFFGLAPYFLFMIATAVTALAGVALSIYYFHFGNIYWLYSLLLLTVMPVGALYLILYIFGIMCVAAQYESFKKITAAERFFALLYNPLYMLEYVPVYLTALVRLHSRKQTVWRQTERIVRDE